MCDTEADVNTDDDALKSAYATCVYKRKPTHRTNIHTETLHEWDAVTANVTKYGCGYSSIFCPRCFKMGVTDNR